MACSPSNVAVAKWQEPGLAMRRHNYLLTRPLNVPISDASSAERAEVQRRMRRAAKACDDPQMTMTSDRFHPDLRSLTRWLPRAPVSPRTLRVMRALTKLPIPPRARDVKVETVGAVTVRVHRPPGAAPRPAMLWIHGGGYVFGTAAQDDAVCRYFATTLDIFVAAVDYRLAPESPFPLPLHDCYAALKWLAGLADVDPTRIAVGGASAGGGLAAAVALLARERNDVTLALQLLAYPMIDDRTANRTDIDERLLRLWNNKANRFGWESYTGRPPGSPDVTGLAAPSRCEDLTRLPPAWIGVGTLDLFHDEDIAYAERLASAGVACELDLVEGAFHGFDVIQPKAGVSRAFRAAQVAALADALGCEPRHRSLTDPDGS